MEQNLRGALILAEGFEETEAIATHDILKRSGKIEIMTIAIGSSKNVRSSLGLYVLADSFLNETDTHEFDFLILPGGKGGVDNIKASLSTMAFIKSFHEQEKPIFAICAAPSILGDLGYLEGKHYTCFPGFQKGNGLYEDKGSVIDGKLVTGKSMAYSIEFAENIVKLLLGEEALQKIRRGTRGI